MNFPSSSNRCVFIPSVFIVGIVDIMSLSRLHSLMSNFIFFMLYGRCTNLVSLCCVWYKCLNIVSKSLTQFVLFVYVILF
jgi:hypothetical protein